MNTIITKHRLETTLNNDNQIILVDEWEQKKSTLGIKAGWFRMYKNIFEVFLVCRSNLEMKILIHILTSTKKNATVSFKIQDIAKKFNVSRMTVSSLVRRFKEIGFIKGGRGLFLINPKMYIPVNANSETMRELQDNWDNLGESK